MFIALSILPGLRARPAVTAYGKDRAAEAKLARFDGPLSAIGHQNACGVPAPYSACVIGRDTAEYRKPSEILRIAVIVLLHLLCFQE